MRIILVNKFWFLKGGAETVLFDTKKLLENAGHTVEVFGMKDKRNIFENQYFIDNVDYRKVKGLKKLKAVKDFIYNKQAKQNFKKLIKDFKPDVVHFHNIYHQLSFSLVDVVKDYQIPSVMTLHDYKLISPNYNLFHHGELGEECLNGKYYKCLFKNCLENWSWSFTATLEAYFRKTKKFEMYIDKYISPSKFLKSKFVANGFESQKIRTLHNPLDCFAFARNDKHTPNPSQEGNIIPSYSAGRQEGNIPSLRRVADRLGGVEVLYFGRLSEEKGINVLMETAKLTPEINYKIAGSGPQEKELKNIKEKDSLDNVEFLGFLDKRELMQEIIKSRLIVVPSIWYENCPMNILESLQYGKPVIASNIGGIPELLPEELLFTPNNPEDLAKSIKMWYNKPFIELKELGQKLKKQVEKTNNPAKYLKNLLSIYEEVQKTKN